MSAASVLDSGVCVNALVVVRQGQALRLWDLAKADVPGAAEQFAAGNETARRILADGQRCEVSKGLALTMLGAYSNGFFGWGQSGQEFAYGFQAPAYDLAWRAGDGHWVIADVDYIGAHARAATVAETAGILAFYRRYAPELVL